MAIEPTPLAGAIVKMVNDRYAPGKLVSPNTTFAELHEGLVVPMLHEIEERFGVRVVREEWLAVRTGGDLIALVAAKREIS